MSEMIDVFKLSKASHGGANKTPIMYRYIEKKTKRGISRSVIITLYATLIEEMGLKHRDKLKVLTDCTNFKIGKVEVGGFAFNYSNSSRGMIRFSCNDLLFSRENQEITEYSLEKGILNFKIKSMDVIIPED